MGTCCVLGKNKVVLSRLPSVGGLEDKGIQDTGLSHMARLLTKGTNALKRFRRNQAVSARNKHTFCP